MKAALVAVLMATFAATPARAERYQLIPVRVVELDGEQMTVSGNSGYWLREHLAAMIREAAGNTVQITVSGRQFEEVAATQDRVADSGRYRDSSRQLLRKGQMIGPSEHYSISVLADAQYRSEGGGIVSFLTRGSASADIQKVNAKVEIVLEPIDVGSGLHGRAIRASGSASETTRANIYLSGRSMDFGNSSSNPEERLTAKAAERAVRDLVSRLANRESGEPIATINISSGHSPQVGDMVAFFRSGAEIARYEVVSVSSGTLGVRTLVERSRPKGDPFRII